MAEAASLDTVYKPYFRKLVLTGRPNITVIGRGALRTLIRKKNQDRKNGLIEKMKKQKSVALTADNWTCHNLCYYF